MTNLESFFMPNIKSDCCENEIVTSYKKQRLESESVGVDQKTLEKYFSRYPTILISFRTNRIKDASYFRKSIIRKIYGLYNKHSYLSKSYKLSPEDLELFNQYRDNNKFAECPIKMGEKIPKFTTL